MRKGAQLPPNSKNCKATQPPAGSFLTGPQPECEKLGEKTVQTSGSLRLKTMARD